MMHLNLGELRESGSRNINAIFTKHFEYCVKIAAYVLPRERSVFSGGHSPWGTQFKYRLNGKIAYTRGCNGLIRCTDLYLSILSAWLYFNWLPQCGENKSRVTAHTHLFNVTFASPQESEPYAESAIC